MIIENKNNNHHSLNSCTKQSAVSRKGSTGLLAPAENVDPPGARISENSMMDTLKKEAKEVTDELGNVLNLLQEYESFHFRRHIFLIYMAIISVGTEAMLSSNVL